MVVVPNPQPPVNTASNLDRPMVPIQYTTSDGQNDRLETPVMNFMKQCVMMLNTITEKDAGLAEITSKDLLDLLSWLAEEPIWGIAEKCLSAEPKRRVLDMITRLTGMITAVATTGGYAMLVPVQGQWTAWTGNVTAQAPLELLMRTILARGNISTLANARIALRNYLTGGVGKNRPQKVFNESGTSKCMFVCRGHAVAASWVVTTSLMRWGVADDLYQWFMATRYTRLVPGPANYRARLTSLTKRVRRDQDILRTAFHNNNPAAPVGTIAPVGCDARLATSWATQAATLLQGGPIFYDRTADNGISFNLPNATIRTRCKRCRTVFRYTCPDEPSTFDEPVYMWHSCAEAVALPTCMYVHA